MVWESEANTAAIQGLVYSRFYMTCKGKNNTKSHLTLEVDIQILTVFPDQFSEFPEFLWKLSFSPEFIKIIHWIKLEILSEQAHSHMVASLGLCILKNKIIYIHIYAEKQKKNWETVSTRECYSDSFQTWRNIWIRECCSYLSRCTYLTEMYTLILYYFDSLQHTNILSIDRNQPIEFFCQAV